MAAIAPLKKSPYMIEWMAQADSFGEGAIFRSRFNTVLFKQKLMQLVITGNQ